MRLHILHVTTYDYRAPVELLAHRMMLSPRASHALRQISADLSCEPASALEWTHDAGDAAGWIAASIRRTCRCSRRARYRPRR